MESVNVFDEKFHSIINDGVTTTILLDKTITTSKAESSLSKTLEPRQPDNNRNSINNSVIITGLTCNYCRIEFRDAKEQREHYKLDWHRYNLKQSLLAKLPLTENEFNDKNDGDDDISSISGSDTTDSDKDTTPTTTQGKIFLQNKVGQVFSIYTCLMLGKKEELLSSDDALLLSRLSNCCVKNQQWTILMLGGGHFAGAIFLNNKPILHKTFHCYTVRAGQGGAQSSRDNKSASAQPKSAGASLRRYNEQALIQHVRNIVDQWKSEIARSSLIFYRASGPFNRAVLFGGGKVPILDRNDTRLRSIPFATRRATYAEVQRAHASLIVAQIYDKNLDFAAAAVLINQRKAANDDDEVKRRNNKLRGGGGRSCQLNRAKSRETITERAFKIDQQLQQQQQQQIESSDPENSSSSSNSLLLNNGDDLVMEEMQLSFNASLEIFQDTLTNEQRQNLNKKNRNKKSRKPLSETKKLKMKEDARKNEIIEVLATGNLQKLKELYEAATTLDSFINEILDDHGNTLLHIAAMNEHNDIITYLLENGANPCLNNSKHQTAYISTQSKDMRDILKQYARDNPGKYNYNKAQIPVNALTDEELLAKKKIQRQLKKEKEKIKKKECLIKKQEDLDKERFLKLSDREKRALAAERRMLNQAGGVTARCFLCASDMSGKVPFEYLGNRFCSVDCLKAHRMQNSLVLS